MHSRALFILCLALGCAAGAASGLVVGLLWRLPLRSGRPRPGIVPYALAWSLIGPPTAFVVLRAALHVREVPAGRLLVVAMFLAVVCAGLYASLALARRLENLYSRQPGMIRWSWRAGRLAAVAALLVMLSWVASPRLAHWAGIYRQAHAAATDAGHPNIILFSFDTLRPDHLSAMGYPRETSPNIDDAIEQGTLFTETISSTSWTIPSHATLLTGASPSRIGSSILDPATSPPLLPDEARTLAETLREKGYRTAAFIGGGSMRSTFGFAQGFDVYDDIMPPSLQAASDTIFLAPEVRQLLNIPRHRFLKLLDPLYLELCDLVFVQNHMLPKDSFLEHADYPRRFWNSAQAVNAKVEAYLKRRPTGPQFLFVHYFDPHSPYDARPPFFGRWGNDGSGLGYIENNGLIEEVMEKGRVLTQREKEILIGSYDEKIAYMDAEFGKLMKRLGDEGLLEGAIVVLFSDHGESFGEHNDLYHGHSLHEELIRILFAVRFPGGPPEGSRIGRQVRAADIMPTILDLAGLEDSNRGDAPPIDGVSLAPLIRGDSTDVVPSEAFSELFATKMRGHESGPFTKDQFSFRMNGWKLVRHSDGGTRLYNLKDDPGERDDLSASRPDLVLQMGGRLTEWLDQGFQRFDDKQSDESRLEELKGLGYIDSD